MLEEHGLRDVRIFGSIARGSASHDSDVDLLVMPERSTGLLQQAAVQVEVSDLLGLPVDLVSDDAIRPDLRDVILREAVSLAEVSQGRWPT
ncbi:nucleotidyltransferase family protein [Tessaracoccus massiliensis]|uniref:nucleotidyltransferase family protein n=1 Tax=Tessaracoccus massiliensis TaxID=1522311 RepID=UPI001C575B19